MKKTFAALALAAAAVLSSAPIATADDYVPGCERIRWGFLGSGYRTICDGPRQPDGSWLRWRREWTPAGYVPGWCSRYSCSSGYYRSETTQRQETYPVTDATVLPGEPGWIPPGTIRIL
ncbi:hypothetical protein PBI_SEBATA_26 [Mycobacterium phage Sebata]|uniref:CDGP domain-containing protein n=5 Tax=Bixzunavirus TaxID=680114 RepID=A0A411CBQ3_9CAUD|nr:hypothetical protein LINSTU_26 [Mycobacterium phage LinStu]YP_009017363.1 hypothetical protein MOMOMIXON_27 [Mycobacterium phage MoMoMixon]YP_009608711.1 hypothetical protein FDI20_gp026 [Mycobacterium phage Sebata]YP_010058123.1 hypothetical protein KHO63_gp024 [Mycobacterium phage QBert]ALF51123.1 hypothetical protein SEA_ERNIEJ_27 [Mycobacterium phage ErnieJ]AXN53858.1 hypothetical protein SEA_RABINOVISH_25 [Mycobacterium phage Rabinovish]QAY03224.1 hypothetical protein SEA_DIETRICK_21 